METVSFTKMEDGTAKEYAFLKTKYNDCLNDVPDNLLKILKQMRGDKMGYKIDRYTHSLQSATRAERDGANEETIVCTLLHDIGDILAPQNHSQVSASILRPYISAKNFWIIEHHGLFQGYYYFHHLSKDRNFRDKYLNHRYFQSCVDFCHKWDQPSFDPNYDTLPLEHFEPIVRKILSKPLNEFD